MLTAREIIDLLRLEPLAVEGGYFRQTWRSEDPLPEAALPSRYQCAKAAGTAIYYLLTDDPTSFSAFHRLPTDEVFHFYLGDPVEQWLLHDDGRVERIVLGHDLQEGQRVQHVVPRGDWQGSRLVAGGHVALLGTTMAPGFDVTDYEGGTREQLITRYPAASGIVEALTRA
jgi:predicted cupin superfamily sugar epimerase